jgi:hypothetical protein
MKQQPDTPLTGKLKDMAEKVARRLNEEREQYIQHLRHETKVITLPTKPLKNSA